MNQIFNNKLDKILYKDTTTIYLEDTDLSGTIYFSKIFQLAHKIFEKFLFIKNISIEKIIHEFNVLMPVVHAEADYIHRISLKDEITITVYLNKLGKSSFALQYKFENKENILATAIITHATISKESGNSVNIPAMLLLHIKNNN
uniref:Thioesterase domain-containing protein n=1 Tax=Cyanidium sp. THAL103 TaxID=3027999 RepID=A0A9Y1MYF1_9RHOD|nr:hypothetical protein CspTHAL103_038 [Cyanidium sp. THAL103]